MLKNALRLPLLALSLSVLAGVAQADAVASLRAFVKDVQQARAQFTQSVTSPDGKKVRKSGGSLEFQRPDHFRFEYKIPLEQIIVGDGRQVWLYDADLNQVTVRPMGQAMGATPAALLSGQSMDRDFTLKPLPSVSGAGGGVTEWVEAVPRQKDGQFQSVRVAFRAGALVALEVLDSFGQKSRMDFSQFDTKVTLAPARFVFTPPPGADVLNQP
jgi:outer membrane lipoprotein carrier protein